MYLNSISVVFCPVMTSAFNDCWKCDFFVFILMYRRRILITKGLHNKIAEICLCVKPGHTAWFIKQSSSNVLYHKI